MASPTFKAVILDNAGSGEDLTWLTTSSSIVLSCVSGAVTLTDESDGGSATIWTGVANDRDILDFYQGARLKATATAAGTTFTVAKHDWQEL